MKRDAPIVPEIGRIPLAVEVDSRAAEVALATSSILFANDACNRKPTPMRAVLKLTRTAGDQEAIF